MTFLDKLLETLKLIMIVYYFVADSDKRYF